MMERFQKISCGDSIDFCERVCVRERRFPHCSKLSFSFACRQPANCVLCSLLSGDKSTPPDESLVGHEILLTYDFLSISLSHLSMFNKFFSGGTDHIHPSKFNTVGQRDTWVDFISICATVNKTRRQPGFSHGNKMFGERVLQNVDFYWRALHCSKLAVECMAVGNVNGGYDF